MPFIKNPYQLVLASKSPRRQQLLAELGLRFVSRTKEIDESIPIGLRKEKAAIFLSEKKAAAFKEEIGENELLITSDTIVCLENEILNKPQNKKEAVKMLSCLSNASHEVITAVTLTSVKKQRSFSSNTKVYFKRLSKEEIDYYIDNFKPYDKAGAYGIQEWIGMIGIERIEGSFYNVMGLPLDALYKELKAF